MYLLIDIGNTSTKVAAYDPEVDRYDIITMATDSGTEEELVDGFVSTASFDRAIISSVVPEALARYRSILDQRSLSPLVVSAEVVLPFSMGYRTPDTLGSDRIAGATGAWEYSKAETSTPTNVVSVDAGTAVTFDVVTAAGVFVGGPIGAGPELLRKALAGDTAQLPEVALYMPADVIAGSSDDAVRAGIMVGFAEGCLGIVRRIVEQLDGETIIVFSGGWGRQLANESGPSAIYRPNNLLDGLVRLLEINQ